MITIVLSDDWTVGLVNMYWYISLLVFFFSSRRRHTRLTCDWSSDVCSSDLVELLHLGLRVMDAAQPGAQRHRFVDSRSRSEERRVGKECRSWVSPGSYKKNNDKDRTARCMALSADVA